MTKGHRYYQTVNLKLLMTNHIFHVIYLKSANTTTKLYFCMKMKKVMNKPLRSRHKKRSLIPMVLQLSEDVLIPCDLQSVCLTDVSFVCKDPSNSVVFLLSLSQGSIMAVNSHLKINFMFRQSHLSHHLITTI